MFGSDHVLCWGGRDLYLAGILFSRDLTFYFSAIYTGTAGSCLTLSPSFPRTPVAWGHLRPHPALVSLREMALGVLCECASS